ncbi:TatD family hydrolase [Treponema parvum]|uniref:TatD family hydrolase n=1 Tax=Treponema parvum TaxID=138851 RepID=A0A975F0H5_9SPIR|nr:TatD family hydrolase [Treponema parvum]QTQ12244.1 TatD family hydrolase [Treponema parvum]
MFSDTHFHFRSMVKDHAFDGSDELSKMALNDVFFALDIGTECGDLGERIQCVRTALDNICETELKEKVQKFIHFSAGIWPSRQAALAAADQVKILETNILEALSSEDPLLKKISAVGECGLDHHWNKEEAEDFNFAAEEKLFEMQLDLAKRLSLPVIVHSRDAFVQTVDCIKNSNYDRGVIHCYSYDLEAAKVFVGRGWYIALGGGLTYTKKAKMNDLIDLVRYIPEDRLLLETDAPYLAPVPFRGKPNTPNFINLTYDFIAGIRGVKTEYLCGLVDRNCRALFKNRLS